MILDYEIYKWLIEAKAIERPTEPKVKADGTVQLDEKTTTMILNGTIFARLIRILKRHTEAVSNTPLQTPPNLKQMKDSNTPGGKVYNWNIVVEALAKLNYIVENDVKTLIIAGDEEMAKEILKEVYLRIMKISKPIGKDKRIATPSSIASSNDVVERLNARFSNKKGSDNVSNVSNTSHSKEKKDPNKSVQLAESEPIDLETQLVNTTTLSEFIIISLSNNLSLTAKQSMALLLNGNKYLAHVIAKGIKGNFDPVIAWFKAVYAEAKHILNLLLKEESTGSVPTMLQVLKPGLYSRSEDVAQWACRVLSKLAYDFAEAKLLSTAWEWFTAENGGLFAFLACFQRHAEIASYITSAIANFARFNLLELFTLEMRKIFVDPLEYTQNALLMLKPLTEVKFTKDELLSRSIIDYLIENALKNADNIRDNGTQLRSASLGLLCDIWEIYPSKIESEHGLSNQILIVIKKAMRDHSSALKLVALTYLFRLLEKFASERNPFAPIIYKILTFALIEHHQNQTLREHIITNFCQVLKNFVTIPIDVLLEPLIKQIQASAGTSYVLNLFDFRLLSTIANHPKLSSKSAVLLLDLLARIYLNSICFAHIAAPPFIKITERFLEDEIVQEYLLEFGKVSLSNYYDSVKRKRTKEKFVKKFVYFEGKDELFAGPAQITPEMEQEIINSQQRALVINILKDIIKLQSSILNVKYKTLLAYTNSQIKQLTSYDDKGIQILLSHFGDPIQIIKEYEEEMNPSHDKKMVEHLNPTYDYYTQASQNFDINSPVALQNNPNVDDSLSQLKRHPRPLRADSIPKRSDIVEIGDEFKSGHFRELPLESTSAEKVQRKETMKSETQTSINLNNNNNNVARKGRESHGTSLVIHNTPKIVPMTSTSMAYDHRSNSRVSEGYSMLDKIDENDSIQMDEKPFSREARGKKSRAFSNAIKAIQEIKKKHIEVRVTQELIDEDRKLRDLKVKEALKKQIAKRRVELGVKIKAADLSFQLTDDEKNDDSILQPGSQAQAPEQMAIVDLDTEELFQKESITIYVKQNMKKFNYLFKKYCFSDSAYKKAGDSFDSLKAQFHSINLAALLKMIRENTLNSLISKEETTQLLKLVNTKLLGNNDFQALNFEGFVKFMIQMAIYIFTKPPLDQENFLYVECIKKLMWIIYLAAQVRGDHKQLTDENYHNQSMDNPEIEFLYQQLRENPYTTLPTGYKKVVENVMESEYKLPETMDTIVGNYGVAYEILDEILFKQFGFHIVEPKAEPKNYVRIIPKETVEDRIAKEVRRQMSKAEDSDERRDDSRDLSGDFMMKRVDNTNYKSIRNVSADVNERRSQRIVINTLGEEKIRRALEDSKKEEEREKKWQKRKQTLQDKMKEITEAKKLKEAQRIVEKQIEQMEREEMERIKIELRKKELEKKKKLVLDYKEKMYGHLKVKMDEQARQRETAKSDSKKGQNSPGRRLHDNLQRLLEEQKRQKLKDEMEREKLKRQRLEEEKKREESMKKRTEIKIQKERENREKEREFALQVGKVHLSAPFQAFYKDNKPVINCVYTHYKENPNKQVMLFNEFMNFGSQLNIFPALLTNEELKHIFHSLTRNTEGEIGLKYDDFQHSLLRIAIKAEPVLSIVSERLKAAKDSTQVDTIKDDFNQTRQQEDRKEEQKNVQGTADKLNTAEKLPQPDEVQDLSGVKLEVLESLMLYLNLPKDIKELKIKLKGLMRGHPKDPKRPDSQSPSLNLRAARMRRESPGKYLNRSRVLNESSKELSHDRSFVKDESRKDFQYRTPVKAEPYPEPQKVKDPGSPKNEIYKETSSKQLPLKNVPSKEAIPVLIADQPGVKEVYPFALGIIQAPFK